MLTARKALGWSALLVLTTAFIDLTNLFDYSSQTVPNYITKNNSPSSNPITDAGATLGRVLFYDKQLSANGTIACASCHIQQFAFSDSARLSEGLYGGQTGRHSMRLAYSRFSDESKFFWDERATSLENQTTRPIQDAVEMGFSGQGGQPGFDSLVRKLSGLDYYKTLFTFVYGDTVITELRVQRALAQFVRSIYSFDSKFDQGLAQAGGNINAQFSNYTAQENQGKGLFLAPPPAGAGCQGCHRAPEFDIDPNTGNNGVIADATAPGVLDLTNTRAPSLRDLFNAQGNLNGPLMHNGNFTTIDQVVEHYNLVPVNPNNTNIDPRLQGPGANLQLTAAEKAALIAFLKTLSSQSIYTGERWANPFDANGNLQLVTGTASVYDIPFQLHLYPNPATDLLQVQTERPGDYLLVLYAANGQTLHTEPLQEQATLDVSALPAGTWWLAVRDRQTGKGTVQSFVKR